MKHNLTLTITSLLSIVLFMLHLADDIVRGFERGGLSNLFAVPIAVAWLYGTLVLAGRRSGYIIVLLFSVLATGIPFIHMQGKGIGIASGIAGSSGGFFFIFTLLAMGVTAVFSVVLAVHGLWNLRRNRT
ncbi:MAG TPA: hypothetical protein VFR78_03735 [Pyrinomonadaceae bacterium]|nr:hypothetical protein [Pyrinomonadaceae bacterium]